ncbi:MAG TPA: O-methyltransferase [Candidatus Dormibacteraeota bacterium]|nr:O-methyltransferase [Candidatus Dormibacteraeota bacterium]
MDHATARTPTRLDAYLGERFWAEDDVLRRLVEDLRVRGPQIHVGPEQGRALSVLVAASGARRVLELGTLFGYSAIWIARALPPDGHLDTVEIDPMHADAAEHWVTEAGLASRVTVHRGAALEVARSLAGPYDAVFMDAVKTEYPAYLDEALRLVRPRGLVLADNVHRGGAVADPEARDEGAEAIREYLRRCATDPRLLSTVLDAGDGLAVSVVRGA